MSEHRAMPDSTLPISSFRISFRPYNHEEVQELLKKAVKDFGPFGSNRRWWFESAQTPDSEINVWIVDFYFREANDAMIFGLKYQR